MTRTVRRKLRRVRVTVILSILVGAYALYIVVFALAQRQVLYPARYRAARGPVPRDVERLSVTIALGRETVPIETWLMRPALADGSVPVLLFAHGNGELIDDWPESMRAVVSHGVAVALVEYPGFGRSGGSPSQASVSAAMAAAYDALAQHEGIDPDRIVPWGRSLGGGAACTLIGRRPLRALVLQSTFTSIRAFAPRYGVPPFLVRDPYDNAEALASFSGPTLILHGNVDDIVPFHHGQRLHHVAPNSTFIEYDAGHNDCPPDWGAFVDDLVRFLVDAGVISGGDH